MMEPSDPFFEGNSLDEYWDALNIGVQTLIFNVKNINIISLIKIKRCAKALEILTLEKPSIFFHWKGSIIKSVHFHILASNINILMCYITVCSFTRGQVSRQVTVQII